FVSCGKINCVITVRDALHGLRAGLSVEPPIVWPRPFFFINLIIKGKRPPHNAEPPSFQSIRISGRLRGSDGRARLPPLPSRSRRASDAHESSARDPRA